MIKKSNLFVVLIYFLVPVLAHASVESSMLELQSKLLGTFLPIASVLGLIFAGLSYLVGSPQCQELSWLRHIRGRGGLWGRVPRASSIGVSHDCLVLR